MIQLPHTGLWVPTPTIAVTAVHEKGDAHTDAVRVATVHYDHTLLGYAVTAYARSTAFVPTGPRAAWVMEDFLAHAEVPAAGKTPPARVLDYLVGEHEWDGIVRTAHTSQSYLFRMIDATGLPLRAGAVELTVPYPDYEAARKLLAHRAFPPETARAELWAGQRWIQIHPEPRA